MIRFGVRTSRHTHISIGPFTALGLSIFIVPAWLLSAPFRLIRWLAHR